MADKEMKTILIGTTNEFKYRMYQDLLSFLKEREVYLQKLPPKAQTISIPETLDSLEANAVQKAVTYSHMTGCFTIADDTGFFIPALNNEPGVAVRRWGGKLPKDISDEAWEQYFLKRMKQSSIEEPYCIRRQVVALSDAQGNCRVIEEQFVGKIKIPGAGHYDSGGPLSSYFFLNECQRFESELSQKNKETLLGGLKVKLINAILQYKEFQPAGDVES